MNKNILKIITEKKKDFVPFIFTEKQAEIIRKYFLGNTLSYNEKHALYTSINKKIIALESIYCEKQEIFYVYGKEKIIEKRIEKAKELIRKFPGKRVFIAGSFLFKEDYNDIDIFLIQQRGYKEIHDNSLHIIKLSEKKLESPVFQSAAMISLSNFPITFKFTKPILKINDLMSAYHESVIEIMDNQERELTRHLIFAHSLFIEDRIIDGAELKIRSEKATLTEIDSISKRMLNKLFSNNYLYVKLHNYVKSLDSAIKAEKSNANLKRYKAVYEEIINDSRRSKAEAA
jgi:hypothetical protein